MIKEIECYITKHYYELLKIAKKYTKNDDWASELLHEVILQLYNKKEYRGKLDDNSLKYYLVRIITINWCYPSSPFYRKYKMLDLKTVDLSEVINMFSEENDMDTHKLLDYIETEWTELNWFNKVIFEKYMVLGSLKKVSKDTTIPLSSIGKYVKETKEIIKTKTLIKFNNE